MSLDSPRPDAPGDAAGGVLVIGYGNTLRSDDGVGWHAAALLADDPRLSGDEVLAVHQLTPELALDMSRASLVILVDASANGAPGEILVRRLAPAGEDAGGRAAPGGVGPDRPAGRGPGAISHHVGPGELLAMARELYGAAPAAFSLSVGVASMEVGETLSSDVAAALPAVADAVVGLVGAHRRSRAVRQPS